MTKKLLTKTWLQKLLETKTVDDATKVTLLLAVLNSGDEYILRVSRNQLSHLRGSKPHVVSKHMTSAIDAGWFVPREKGTARFVGVLNEPETRPTRPRKIVRFSSAESYESVPVKDWKAIHFAEFFCDLMENKGHPAGASPKKIANGILKNGVQKLRQYDRSQVHPKVRYRQFLEWVAEVRPESKNRGIISKNFMRAFIAQGG